MIDFIVTNLRICSLFSKSLCNNAILFYQHLPAPVFWWCVISLVFFACYILFKLPNFFSKASKLKKALSGTQFKKNTTLNEKEKKAIATSAIYSAQQGAFVNALETGLGKNSIKEILESWWGINDANDAVNTLEYLQHGGYQQTYPLILAALDNKEQSPSQFFEENIQELELVDKLVEQTYNLKSCFGELKEDKIIETGNDLKRYGVVGWDSGRLSFMARLCHEMEYIDENTAWKYINAAYDLAKQNFTNWNDFSKSYVIGRAMWGGAGTGNSGIAAIADDLLNKKPSPFEGGMG